MSDDITLQHVVIFIDLESIIFGLNDATPDSEGLNLTTFIAGALSMAIIAWWNSRASTTYGKDSDDTDLKSESIQNAQTAVPQKTTKTHLPRIDSQNKQEAVTVQGTDNISKEDSTASVGESDHTDPKNKSIQEGQMAGPKKTKKSHFPHVDDSQNQQEAVTVLGAENISKDDSTASPMDSDDTDDHKGESIPKTAGPKREKISQFPRADGSQNQQEAVVVQGPEIISKKDSTTSVMDSDDTDDPKSESVQTTQMAGPIEPRVDDSQNQQEALTAHGNDSISKEDSTASVGDSDDTDDPKSELIQRTQKAGPKKMKKSHLPRIEDSQNQQEAVPAQGTDSTSKEDSTASFGESDHTDPKNESIQTAQMAGPNQKAQSHLPGVDASRSQPEALHDQGADRTDSTPISERAHETFSFSLIITNEKESKETKPSKALTEKKVPEKIKSSEVRTEKRESEEIKASEVQTNEKKSEEIEAAEVQTNEKREVEEMKASEVPTKEKDSNKATKNQVDENVEGENKEGESCYCHHILKPFRER